MLYCPLLQGFPAQGVIMSGCVISQVMIKSTLPGTRWELQFADAYYSMCRNYGVEVLALRCSEILLNSAEAVSSCKSNINAATSFPSSFALDQSALQPFMVLITDKNERPEVRCMN